ncbi:MAG: hypothetical protein HYX62_03100 [Gammaproteobacteria bacterium]|nr:hypothetical protein [Gammaproteobacteria bacterium]
MIQGDCAVCGRRGKGRWGDTGRAPSWTPLRPVEIRRRAVPPSRWPPVVAGHRGAGDPPWLGPALGQRHLHCLQAALSATGTAHDVALRYPLHELLGGFLGEGGE